MLYNVPIMDEILIPCPNCKSLLRYAADSHLENALDKCLICGEEFSEVLRTAIDAFVTDTQMRGNPALPVIV
jgi:hypothetical protein